MSDTGRMSRFMKPTTKETDDRRQEERRVPPSERRDDIVRAVSGERRVVEKRGVAMALVDALDDILMWERASERTIRIAAQASSNGCSN